MIIKQHPEGKACCGKLGSIHPVASCLGLLMAISWITLAQSPRLRPPKPDGNGNVILELQSQIQADYTVEKSSDFSNWSFLFSGMTTNGILRFTEPMGSANARSFYRGWVGTNEIGGPPPRVHQTIDPDQSVTMLVTTNQEVLSLTNQQGVRFTLEVPANAFLEPQIISMTLVTNLAGNPFDGTNLWAVAFEPEGLEFLGPAMFSIDLPTAVPVESLASYWYSADTADFGLMPDAVWTNRIQFPIYHFSGYGAGTTGNATYQGQASRSVRNSFQQLNQQIAVELRGARKAGKLPFGETALPSDIKNQVAATIESFLEKRYGPNGPVFMGNCSGVNNEILRIPQILFLLRRHGMTQDDVGQGVMEMVDKLCPAIQDCMSKALADCRAHKPGAYEACIRLKQAVFDNINTCNIDFPSSLLRPCAPAWTGTLWYHAEGSTNYDKSSTMQRAGLTRNLKVEVNAVVTDSIDFSPAADSHIFVLTFARSWLAVSKGSSTDESWGCEGAADYPHGLNSIMKKDFIQFRTNDEQSVQLTISGTNVTMLSSMGSISGLLGGPMDLTTTTTRRVDCFGKNLQFSVNSAPSNWGWMGQADINTPSQVLISTNLIQVSWTNFSMIMDTPVAERAFLQLIKNE